MKNIPKPESTARQESTFALWTKRVKEIIADTERTVRNSGEPLFLIGA